MQWVSPSHAHMVTHYTVKTEFLQCIADCSSPLLAMWVLQCVQSKARYTTPVANLVTERVRIQIHPALTSVNLVVPVHLTWWCTMTGASLSSCAPEWGHRLVSFAFGRIANRFIQMLQGYSLDYRQFLFLYNMQLLHNLQSYMYTFTDHDTVCITD